MIALLHITACSVTAQCTVGINQPGPYYYYAAGASYPQAWPRVGWKLLVQPVQYFSNARYVFCDGLNCNYPVQYPGFSLPDAARQAFTNWTNARISNNSQFSFVEHGTTVNEYFTSALRILPGAAIEGAAATTTTYLGNIDYTGDGNPETLRIEGALVQVNDAITNAEYMRHIIAHEVGHSMALNDRYTCSSGRQS
jgi:hypothetical protein